MRRRVAIGIIGWLAWPVCAGAQAPPISGQDVRTFDLVYETEVQRIPSGAGVDVWIPLPPDDPYQEIVTQRVDTPYDWTVYTDPEYGNKILHLSLADADVRTIPITVSFRVRRREHVQPLLNRRQGARPPRAPMVPAGSACAARRADQGDRDRGDGQGPDPAGEGAGHL